jgi:hypothetical protein
MHGPLALQAVDAFRTNTLKETKSYCCHTITENVYEIRLNVITHFVAEVAASAKIPARQVLLSFPRMSYNKLEILNRMLLVHGSPLHKVNEVFGPAWIEFRGTEAIPTPQQIANAVRQAITDTRYSISY